MIENILKYYYNLTDFNIKNKNDNYIIRFNNAIYYFCSTSSNEEEIKEIYDLYNEINKYSRNTSQIIPNKFNEITTKVNNGNYIMIKIGKKNIDLEFSSHYDHKKYSSLYRTRWNILWSKKIDYLEYQREHIKGNYKVLDKYFDFFVGMTECAIALFTNTLEEYKNLPIAIQHKRYNDFFYDNPMNVIIDYRVRDIAELIKYKYFYQQIDINLLEGLLKKMNIKEGEEQILFSRLLFPSFYFDIYNEIVNNKKNEKEIEKYEMKFKSYLLFLKKISELKYFKNIKESLKWLK